jgi:DNA-binding NarL/FixJ family response regulator
MVVHGRTVMDPRIAGAPSARRQRRHRDGAPSPRASSVLLIARGLTTQEIGEALGLSPNTVKSHSRSLFTKLEAHNRVQALAIAKERGLLS